MAVKPGAAQRGAERQRFGKPAEPTKAKAEAPKKRKPKAATNGSGAEHTKLIAEAKAKAETERQAATEQLGIEADTETGPALPKAVRDQIRRAERRPIGVELTIAQGAMLDQLAKVHGSQRAAIGLAIEQLYNQTSDG